MDNSTSMQIFISPKIAEGDLLDFLSEEFSFIVDSVEIEIPNAVGFAQISNYPEGFEQGILVSWPNEVHVALSPPELLKGIAMRFKVRALLEPNSSDEEWLLADQSGDIKTTTVSYLDDGLQPTPSDQSRDGTD